MGTNQPTNPYDEGLAAAREYQRREGFLQGVEDARARAMTRIQPQFLQGFDFGTTRMVPTQATPNPVVMRMNPQSPRFTFVPLVSTPPMQATQQLSTSTPNPGATNPQFLQGSGGFGTTRTVPTQATPQPTPPNPVVMRMNPQSPGFTFAPLVSTPPLQTTPQPSTSTPNPDGMNPQFLQGLMAGFAHGMGGIENLAAMGMIPSRTPPSTSTDVMDSQ